MRHVCMFVMAGWRGGGGSSSSHADLCCLLCYWADTLVTDQLHHCCHREHLVITSSAQPPAEFTEPSPSPVTRLCLCTSLLETLDMLNTPIRQRPSFSTRSISLRKNFAEKTHLHRHVYTRAHPQRTQTFISALL